MTRAGLTACVLAVVPTLGCSGDKLNEILFGPATPVQEAPPPAPSPTPTPIPTPEPSPQPTPDPDEPRENTGAVREVTARVFFVECGGSEIPGSEYASEAAVGCRLHLDCTPRDVYHQPTRPHGGPAWAWTPGLTKGGSRSDYTPVLTIEQPGQFTASVEIDGVRSNHVVVRFH